MFYEKTQKAIERSAERFAKGKASKEDDLLMLLSDGEWHYGREMTEKVSWRFGGYLFNLKQDGVAWEKERMRVKGACVYRYRLSQVDEPSADAL